MTTRLELWKEVVGQLNAVVAVLDQARATLKDLNMADGMNDLIRDAEMIRRDVRDGDCDECGHLISKHEDKYGCQYERGDEGKPCGCDWWAQPVRKD